MGIEHTPEDAPEGAPEEAPESAHARRGEERRAPPSTRGPGPSGQGRGRDRAAKGGRRRLKSFLVRKDGHLFSFVYPPEHERAAIRALTGCPRLDPADVLALVCYLGHDPRELGL